MLTAAAGFALAGPAAARPLLRLHDAPKEILSPTFADADGNDRTLADFRGRVILLNIWATWCVPCREEMPTLDALQGRLGGAAFQVLPVSIDRGGFDVIRGFYDDIGIRHLGMYLAESTRAMFALGVLGLPTTILIDRDGLERGRLVGPAEWDSPEVIGQIAAVIAERSN